MDGSGLELKRRQIEQQHGSSEATSLLETFKGGSPKIVFICFAIADQFFNCLDRGVAVGIGLGLALQSLPLAGVAIGKFNRGADQSKPALS
jgi:hypothetical protein